MSLLERRLQVLLDQGRYDRLAREADRTGRSVAAVVRDAIDARYPSDISEASAALRELLQAHADPGSSSAQSPRELKDSFDAALDAKLANL